MSGDGLNRGKVEDSLPRLTMYTTNINLGDYVLLVELDSLSALLICRSEVARSKNRRHGSCELRVVRIEPLPNREITC
jgi:hypothetical protein